MFDKNQKLFHFILLSLLFQKTKQEQEEHWNVWGSHSSVAKDSSLLDCQTTSNRAWLPGFQATMSLQNVSYVQSTWHTFTVKTNLHEQHHYCSTIPNIFQQLLYFIPAKNQVFKLIKWLETIFTSWQPKCLGLHQVQRKHYWADDGNTPTGS